MRGRARASKRIRKKTRTWVNLEQEHKSEKEQKQEKQKTLARTK